MEGDGAVPSTEQSGCADFRDDLLRRIDPKARDFGEALDGVMMCRKQVGHLLIELAEVILDHAQRAVRYEERGPAVSAEAKKVRARKMIRELRSLGYRIELSPAPSSSPA